MIVYRISKRKYAGDLTGYGAYLYGGRWSTKGTYALYTANHRSLAYLEFLVHQLDRDSSPRDVVISEIEIKNASSLTVLSNKDLPTNWNSLEHHPETQSIAAKYFSDDCLGIIIPSVIIPEESNTILNPNSSYFKNHVKVLGSQPILLDKRFYGLD